MDYRKEPIRAKYILFCISILIIVPIGLCAETHTSFSASYSDVLATVSNASSGDTVIVPIGAATWSSTLTITKGVILRGSGVGNTVITSNINNSNSGPFLYDPVNPGANEKFEITGFTIDGGNKSRCLTIVNNSNNPLTKVTVHNNLFTNSQGYALRVYGPIYGVAYSNQFEGNSTDMLISGRSQDAWDSLTAEFGKESAFFVESNTIICGSSGLFPNGGGAQFVFRYNTITDCTAFGLMDMHGNNHNPVVSGYTQARACLNGEIYENTFVSTRGHGHKWMYLRGGSLLMYNNSITGYCAGTYIQLTDYDLYPPDNLIPSIVTHNGNEYICLQDHTSTSANEPGTGGGAAYWEVTTIVPRVMITWQVGLDFLFSQPYDPITDSYFFNNKVNGVDAAISKSNDADELYIIENINYWLADPRGKIIKGASYTPYVYPHPLAGSSAPGKPSGIRIK